MGLFEMLNSQLAVHRDRLASLLTFVREHIPFYQQTIPQDVARLVSDSEHWQQIPLLTKQQIQTNWLRFLSKPDIVNDSNVVIMSTSGSTGTPLKIARPRSELRAQTKRIWATRTRWYPGIMRWELVSLYSNVESQNQRVLQIGAPGEFLDISSDALASHARKIDEFKPDWMCGDPTCVYRLAEFYRQRKQGIPTLKLIQTTGEHLYPHQRSVIEDVFSCRVSNVYGCREFWVLSWECPYGTMHAWTDDLLFEVIRDGQPALPGEEGELVVTTLTNPIMPLVRYRLGDYVQMAPSSCLCGDPRPALTPLGGRTASVVITRKRSITSFVWDRVFSEYILHHDQSLVEYQVVQLDYDHLEIRLVPGERFEENIVTEQLAAIIYRFLPELECRFIICSSIAPESSGKTRTFVSHIPPSGFQPGANKENQAFG